MPTTVSVMAAETTKTRYLIVGGTSGAGGLQIHTADLARSLVANGHEVSILSTSIDLTSQLLVATPIRVVNVCDVANAGGLSEYIEWLKTIWPHRGARAILTRGQAGESSNALLLALRFCGLRIYAIEHGYPELYGRRTRSFERLQRRYAAWLIHRSVSVSEAVRRPMIERFEIPPRKTCVVHNWVAADRFKPNAQRGSDLRASVGAAPDDFVFGYVGRLSPEKRIDLLIRGFAAARTGLGPGAKLLLIGGGWKEQELRALARSEGADDAVIFTGWQADSSDWYSALDAFVLPSEQEGLPLSALEALASGTPCLLNRFESSKELITDGKDGFIASLDTVPQVSSALQRMANLSPEERARISGAARATAISRFAPAGQIPRLLSALDAESSAALLTDGANYRLAPRTLEKFGPGPKRDGFPGLVSIVLPTHNRARFLESAIRSVGCQSYQQWELLVVDDRSTDQTEDLVRGLAQEDPRIVYVANSHRPGPGAARNCGLELAKGEFVAFLDSDDRWEPTKLSRQLESFAKNPLANMVASDDWLLDRENGTRRRSTEKTLQMLDWIEEHEPARDTLPCERIRSDIHVIAYRYAVLSMAIADFLWIHTSSVMVRRGVFERVGMFDERAKTYEDTNMWLRINDISRIVLIDEPLCTTDISGGGDRSGDRFDAVAPAHRRTEIEGRRGFRNLLHFIRGNLFITNPQRAFLRHQLATAHRKTAAAYWRRRHALALWHHVAAFRYGESRFPMTFGMHQRQEIRSLVHSASTVGRVSQADPTPHGEDHMALMKVALGDREHGSPAAANGRSGSKSQKPRLLFVSPVMPVDRGLGVAMRAGLFLDALAEDFTVDLLVVPISEDEWSKEIPPFTLRRTARIAVVDGSKIVDTHWALIEQLTDPRARLAALAEYPRPLACRQATPDAIRAVADRFAETRYDCIHVFRMHMILFAAPFTESEPRRPLQVLDLDEFDGLAQERFAQLCSRNGDGLAAAEFSINAGKSTALIRDSVHRFDRVLVCTGTEIEKLREARIEGGFGVIPNAYEITGNGASSDGSSAFDFVFVGTFGYLPNVDAMRFFCTEIWPKICEAAVSPPTLAIVGRNPPDEIKQLDEVAGVTVTGAVPETAPYYRNSRVAIVPLRAGGGTRIKILEAFALGVPVVSTTIGAEGLDVESGRHLLIADTPDEFAAACLRLLRDNELRERLVQSAADLFHRTHSVPVVKDKIRRTYRELVHGT